MKTRHPAGNAERLREATDDVTVLEIEAPQTQQAAVPLQLTEEGRPDPDWIRGRCPECGDDLVSNLYWVGGQGYILRWECWGSLQENPQCHYRRVL